MDNEMIEAIIVVILIGIYMIYDVRRDFKRRDVLANYRAAERFGRYRVLYSEHNNGVIFENDPYRIENWHIEYNSCKGF